MDLILLIISTIMDTKNLLVETQLLAAEILYKNYPIALKIADNLPQVYLVKNVFFSFKKQIVDFVVWAVKLSKSRYGSFLIHSGFRLDSPRINSAVFLSFSEKDILKRFQNGDFITPYMRLEHTHQGRPRITVLVQIRNTFDARKVLQKTFSHLEAPFRDIRLIMCVLKKEKRYYWAVIKNGIAYGVNINGKEALTFPLWQIRKIYSLGERINADYRLKVKSGFPCLKHVKA